MLRKMAYADRAITPPAGAAFADWRARTECTSRSMTSRILSNPSQREGGRPSINSHVLGDETRWRSSMSV
jgi:hypothetical protein